MRGRGVGGSASAVGTWPVSWGIRRYGWAGRVALLVVAGACGWLGLPAVASAETVMILEASGSSSQVAGAARLVGRFVERVEGAGWTVQRPTPREQEVVLALIGCDAPGCALAGLSSLGVDLVVAPAVWQRVDGRIEFAMSVQGPSGQALELVAPIDAAHPLDAADALATRVLAAWPSLRIVPEPSVVETPRHAPTAPRSVRSPWNVPIGIALAVASIAPMAIGATAVVRDGDCVVPDSQGACPVSASGTIDRYHAGARSYSLLAGGLALAGAGIVVLAVGPVRVRPSVDVSNRSAALGVAGSF